MADKQMLRVILNVNDASDLLLAGRSARYLIEHPEEKDALLDYGDTPLARFWVKRGKGSIIVWQQGTPA